MKKRLILSAVVIVAAIASWRYAKHDTPDAKLVFDRFWIDHEPRSQDEKFLVFFVESEQPFGRFVTRTVWTGVWEGFHYHVVPRQDGVLDLLFGATRERQRVRYVARRCNEKNFDFCLEISGSSRGTQRYYSKREWQAKNEGDADQIANQLLAR